MTQLRKSFDLSKFKKSITKSIQNISIGFSDPVTWISTGNFALNKKISGQFDRGIPLSKLTMLAGFSGSGKSYLASGSVVKHAQEQGIFCVIIDTENALDEKWLNNIGVSTDEDKLMRLSASLIDDVAKILYTFITDYKEENANLPMEEQQPILFVIDSLGMLSSPVEVDQFTKGDMKGDMGRKPKQLKALVTQLTNMIEHTNIGILMTNHVYDSQDMFSPDPKISGGNGIIFASSIVISMDKGKLKLDEDGNKTSSVNGITVRAQVAKSRFAQPFQKINFHIPWESGLDPYSGLIDLFESEGLISKDGNKIKYIANDGTEYKEFRKNFGKDILDIIMKEYDTKDKLQVEEDEVEE